MKNSRILEKLFRCMPSDLARLRKNVSQFRLGVLGSCKTGGEHEEEDLMELAETMQAYLGQSEKPPNMKQIARGRTFTDTLVPPAWRPLARYKLLRKLVSGHLVPYPLNFLASEGDRLAPIMFEELFQ